MIRALATLTATTRAVGTRATSSVRQPLRPNALRPHGIHKRRRGCGRVIIEALAARPLLVARPGAFLPFEGLPVLKIDQKVVIRAKDGVMVDGKPVPPLPDSEKENDVSNGDEFA